MSGFQVSMGSLANMGRKYLAVAIGVTVGLLASCPAALAAPGDPLEFFVDETITHDSNVFRVARDRVSDTLAATTAGMRFDVPVSLQRFQGELSVNDNRYSRLDELNYTGHDLRAAWLWQVGAPLTGQLGYTDSRRLASFANYTLPTRTSDELTARRLFGSAAWMMSTDWRLQGGLAEQRYEHDERTRRINDVDISSADVALSYVSRADNNIGIGWRQDDASYPEQIVGDNDFRQQSFNLFADWSLTEKSRIRARLGQAEREFDRATRKDLSRTVARVDYDWLATDKLSLNAVAQRDFAPVEDIETSIILVTGIALRPRLVLSEQMALSGNLDYSTRDYLGTDRTDHVRVFGATLGYRPMESLALSLLVQHEKRASDTNIGDYDYDANVIAVSARLSF